MLVLVMHVPPLTQGQAGVEKEGQYPRTQRHIYSTSFSYVRQVNNGVGNTPPHIHRTNGVSVYGAKLVARLSTDRRLRMQCDATSLRYSRVCIPATDIAFRVNLFVNAHLYSGQTHKDLVY